MKRMNETQLLAEIILALEKAGHNPYEQLMGYIELNNDIYITRQGNAREKIKFVSNELIISELKKQNYIK